MSQETLSRIAGRYGLDLIVQFGSTVTAKEHAGSDVDIAVRFESAVPGFGVLAALASDLQELFADREVDLAVINRADPLFLKKITEACRLLYGDPTALYELKIYAFKRYQDHRPYFAMEKAYVQAFLKEKAPTS
ncbi:MAG: nucleotidyltransferase domain-containing protein [Acidobacteria bacterium]|nr:nucleotidyltransferase domain-containing protein [Acidobacteriota bacterium]